MKVLVLNRDPAAFPGGDLIHIRQLSNALAKLGIQRDYAEYSWTTETCKRYDLIHIYHTNFTWSEQNFRGAVGSGKPIVLTAVFYPTEKLGLDGPKMLEYLKWCSRVVCYSLWEMRELREITCYEGKVDIIPPGVGYEFFCRDDPDDRQFVMTSSARRGDKNTDMVEDACYELNLPYRLIQGVEYHDLPAVYRNCRVFVNASGSERFGLNILESLASECRVLATVHSRALEWFPGIATIDPGDFDDIKRQIRWAWNTRLWSYIPNEAARQLTWDRAAKSYEELYRGVL